MNVDYPLIGNRIKEARKEKAYTQQVVAQKLNVSIGYVSQVERGLTKISLDLLGAIAGILEKDLSYFVGGASVTASNYLFSEIDADFARLSPADKQLTANFIKMLLDRQ